MTILAAVADDDLRAQVLEVGIEMARAFGEPLYVVHLTDDEVADAEARQIRSEMSDRLTDAGIEYDVAVEHVGLTRGRSGKAAGKQLVEIASDVSISHLVVGHHTKRALRNLTEGSTAVTVADAASVPVTIVPETLQ
jgi:nucleotide-binding universal stress UspA family protein